MIRAHGDTPMGPGAFSIPLQSSGQIVAAVTWKGGKLVDLSHGPIELGHKVFEGHKSLNVYGADESAIPGG